MLRFLETQSFAWFFRIATWVLFPALCWAAWTLYHLKTEVLDLRAEADQCVVASARPPVSPSLR